MSYSFNPFNWNFIAYSKFILYICTPYLRLTNFIILYMRTIITKLMNNAFSQIAMLLIVISMVGYSLALKIYGCWTPLAVVATVFGSIILCVWLAWCLYIIVTKRIVSEMPPRATITINILSYLFLTSWLYITTSSMLITLIWVPLFVWYIYRTIEDRRQESANNPS